MNLRKKLIALLLTLTLMLSLGAAASAASDIDSLKEQKAELADQSSSLQSQISSLRGEQSQMMELKAALDLKNELTMLQILNLGEQIDLHETLIAQKSEEVEAAQALADEQHERYRERVRAMEENGRFSYFEVLFGAESISEFLSLVDDIADIMRSDRELEASYLDSVSKLEAAKSEYEQAQLDLKSRKAELVALSDQLQQDIVEADNVIVSLSAQISSNSELLAQFKKQQEALQKEIDDKIAALTPTPTPTPSPTPGDDDDDGKKDESGGSSTGSLIWPSYCTYITSRQGPRVDPVTGAQNVGHGGTDIGASYGSPIYAADGGTVTVSGYEEYGYGSYIVIDHGNGMKTLYGHMSAKAVSQGDTVSQGQVIGYVGSSGKSTGPHLHFEVRVDGQRVNPENYYNLSFTYAPDA